MIAEPTHEERFAAFAPAAALTAFERFVQAQRPAESPWAPVTDYSVEARRAIEGRRPQLIKDVFNPKIVADAGCGPDAHLVKFLRELGVNALGLDPQIVENPFARYLIRGSLFDDFEDDPIADLVICREVLEHLTVQQVAVAVKNLVQLSSKYIYLTTRFNQTPVHLFDVQDHDDLDPTHITLMPRDLLRLLFVLEGCTSRLDLEAQMDWGPVGRSMVFEVPAR